ncbi:MAG TPA: response regulator [Bacteroidia bacterium]|nr:response regulator [Bacteroidia bacterium]
METEKFIFDRVMIIDDTQQDRYIASFVIRKYNFGKEVLEFDMATKAIKFLEENQSEIEKLPQVILLDIRMPQMDGFEFLERLAVLPQSIKNSCCIIMISSSLDPSDHERAQNNPVVKKFLNKPLNKTHLEEISKLFNENIKCESKKTSY